MDIEFFRDYCLKKKGVTEELPFDESTLVFKVLGKMFALCNLDNFESTNLKCGPDYSEELREQYNGVTPGYHMNKKHWNTVYFEDDVEDKLLLSLIDHSYEMVVKGLPKKSREQL